MKRNFLFILAIAALFTTFASCDETSALDFKPNECTFSEVHEIEAVMVEASDKAFHGKLIEPGLSPALQTADTTFFVYKHFDNVLPVTICGEKIDFMDTVRVLGRTAETKDYNKSTYYLVDIVEVLEVRPTSVLTN